MHDAHDLPGPARLILWRMEEQLRSLSAEVEALKRQSSEWRTRALQAEAREAEKDKRIQERERRLAFYENENVPPSQPTIKPKPSKQEKAPKRRGKPKGKRGATRRTPPIDQVVDVTADRCPGCGGHPGESTGTDVRPITERSAPAPATTTQYNLATYQCRCGHAFTAPHPDVPREGVWGPRMLTHFSLLHMQLRGRIRGCVAFLLNQDGVQISQSGFWDAIQRTGRACRPAYAAICEALARSPYVYVDETKFKVKGRTWWLWTFRHPDGRVLVVLRPRRDRDVVNEILGKDPPPLVVDGHSAYKHAKVIQRCWAHLLRKVKHVLERVPGAEEEGKALLAELQGIHGRLKEALDGPMDLERRRSLKAAFDEELEGVVAKHGDTACLMKAVTYLRNGLGLWTTCLLYPATGDLPGMETTNNLSETAIREHAVVRKLIGTFRSEEGAENYQYLASMFETWRFQGKNPSVELEGLLRRHLCLGGVGGKPPPESVPAMVLA